MSTSNAVVNNPLFLADFPDPAVLFVDGTFFMTTTSMHFMPGIPIMRSYDLANWEVAAYVYPTFLSNAAHNLTDGQNIYANGSWATSLRYHKEYFYVCFNCNDAQNTFVYRTKNILEGPWEHSILPGFHHDPSLLFEEDDRVYLVYGNGTIYIMELTGDAMRVKPDGIHRVLVDTPKVDGLNCEGSHIHKIDGRYYLMLIQWPKTGTGRRIQWCYRCDTLLGTYEGRVVLDDSFGYKNNGVAQGGLFCANGHWYAMLFQDHDSVGRCPVLLPVVWEDGWPVLGRDGTVPATYEVPFPARPLHPFTASDEFDYEQEALSLIWQFNHNPDNRYWSVTVRPGFLRLTNGTVSPCLVQARNTLTQHTVAPTCTFWTKLDTDGMRPGDCAGIAAFQHHFGMIGIYYGHNGKQLTMRVGNGAKETTCANVALEQTQVYLKVDFDFTDGTDIARFYYSYDETVWREFGTQLKMTYLLEHFAGYRAALFSYATLSAGGYADFDFMRFSDVNPS